jgi:hypothetical protein
MGAWRFRYNPADLLDLIGKESMIPLEVLKESPTYEFLLNEGKDRWKEEGLRAGLRKGRRQGRQEGRQEGRVESAAEILRLMIVERFPRVAVTQKLKQLRDVALLEQLCLEVGKPPNAALRKRLDEAIKAQSLK